MSYPKLSSAGAGVGVEEQPVFNRKTGYGESSTGLRASSTSATFGLAHGVNPPQAASSRTQSQTPFCLSSLVTPSLDIDAMCLRIIASTKLLAAIDPRLGAKVVEYASSLSTELHKSSSTTPAMYATLSNIDSNDSGNTATTLSTQAVQPSSAATISLSNNEPAGMNPLQNWTVEQLEARAKQFLDLNKPVPQSISLLLESGRNTREKEEARKIAKRKSQAILRERKKMKEVRIANENEKLKRESSILSFLPDPVMTIGTDGEITFCNTRMKRLLKMRSSKIIGANIEDLLMSSSKEDLRKMIRDVLGCEQQVSNICHMAESDSLSSRCASVASMPLNLSGSNLPTVNSSHSGSSSRNSCTAQTKNVSLDCTSSTTSSFPQEVRGIFPRPPSCKVRLINSIACELTASVRTISPGDDDFVIATFNQKQNALMKKDDKDDYVCEIKEIVLSFRPISSEVKDTPEVDKKKEMDMNR